MPSNDEPARDEVICHIHNSNNRSIGKGKGRDLDMALNHAIKDVEKSRRDMPDKGSFGCGTKQEGQQMAHQRAKSVQDEDPDNIGELPGAEL